MADKIKFVVPCQTEGFFLDMDNVADNVSIDIKDIHTITGKERESIRKICISDLSIDARIIFHHYALCGVERSDYYMDDRKYLFVSPQEGQIEGGYDMVGLLSQFNVTIPHYIWKEMFLVRLYGDDHVNLTSALFFCETNPDKQTSLAQALSNLVLALKTRENDPDKDIQPEKYDHINSHIVPFIKKQLVS